MSAKEGSGAKKEKSFNGTKAKYSPNLAVPDKKEVKLRRKESEKVKQPTDSSRKSVLGRFFHNLVDSDDSRKKAALADSKKKRTSRDLEGSGTLDLPEHGIVRRNPPALQRDTQLIPNPRLRSMTLANQARENRNRWSSYDIHGSNFVDGVVPQPALPQNSSTLSHRWQSEETLNASPSDPKFSKIADTFVTHPDIAKQPDAMRKHAQLLQSIEKANASKANWSERTTEPPPGGQGSNGWLMTTAEMGGDQQMSDQKQNKLPDAPLSKKIGNDDVTKNIQQKNGASLSADPLVLLNEKSRQIDKALADKRKILSELFSTSEDDMNRLIEKDVELSSDLSIRKMILISLLQSDQLTSVLNRALIPHKKDSTNGSADKEVASAAKDGNISECHSHSLRNATLQLHKHLTLLKDMVNQDVEENNRLKKDLEETQKRLEMTTASKNSASAKSDVVTETTLTDQEVGSHGQDFEQPRSREGNKTEQKESDDEAGGVKKQIRDKDSCDGDMTWNNPDDIKLVDIECEIDERLPDSVCWNTLHHTTDFTENSVNEKKVPDETTLGQPHLPSTIQSESFEPLHSGETSGHQSDEFMSNEMKLTANGASVLTDLCDLINLEKPDKVEDVVGICCTDNGRMFRNLESIPEDDDRLSCCDIDQKIIATEDVNQEVFDDDTRVTTKDEDDTQIRTVAVLNEDNEDLTSGCNDDDRPNVEIEERREHKVDKDLYESNKFLNQTEDLKLVELPLFEMENKTEMKEQQLSSAVLQDILECTEVDSAAQKIPVEDDTMLELNLLMETSMLCLLTPNQSESFKLLQPGEISGQLTDEFTSNEMKVTAKVLNDSCDLIDLENPEKVEDVAACCTDNSRILRNLESIPEADDRLTCCDVDQKIVANEDANREVFEDDTRVITEGEGDTQIGTIALLNEDYEDLTSIHNDDKTKEADIICKLEGTQSNFECDAQLNVNDSNQWKVESDARSNAIDVHSSTDDSASCLDNDSQLNVTVVHLNTNDSKESVTDVTKTDDKCSEVTLYHQGVEIKMVSVVQDLNPESIFQSHPADELAAEDEEYSDLGFFNQLESKIQEFSESDSEGNLEKEKLSESDGTQNKEFEVADTSAAEGLEINEVENVSFEAELVNNSLAPEFRSEMERESQLGLVNNLLLEKVEENSVDLLAAENGNQTMFTAESQTKNFDSENGEAMDLGNTIFVDDATSSLVQPNNKLETSHGGFVENFDIDNKPNEELYTESDNDSSLLEGISKLFDPHSVAAENVNQTM